MASVSSAQGTSSPAVTRLSYVIGSVHRALRTELQTRLRESGLTVPEYTALSVIQSRPGLSNAQLARRSLITPQSMNEVVATLEGRGLIRREAHASHQRILRAELTPEGERMLSELGESVSAMEDAILADLTPQQRRALMDGLLLCMHRLAAGLDS